MSWKEFLKPTKGKIILFIIIMLLMVFLPLDSATAPCQIPPCPVVYTTIYKVLMMASNFNVLTAIGILIVSYAISCSVVSARNRQKKQKQKS